MRTSSEGTDCSQGCVVTSGTYANSQFFLEYRPFIEDVHFWGINPGMEWRIGDRLHFDLQGNWTESRFHRESPSVVVITPASSGVAVDYTNNGGVPDIQTNVDLNDPASFGWPGGRVNIQDERRRTRTRGIRGNLQWGDSVLDRLEGMYVFVLVDRVRAVAVAARDPFGIKPLYLTQRGRTIGLASEMRPLFRLGEPKVDETALAELLTFTWAAGSLSNVEGIERVPGGTLITIPLQGGPMQRRRFCQTRGEPVLHFAQHTFHAPVQLNARPSKLRGVAAQLCQPLPHRIVVRKLAAMF